MLRNGPACFEAAARHTPGTCPGEPVFVPARGAPAEDDGVVLSIVLDAAGPHSGSWLPGARVPTMSTSLSTPDEE
ncbi:carotenoid oxygenase family protein [Streptomyces sp. NPDC002526]